MIFCFSGFGLCTMAPVRYVCHKNRNASFRQFYMDVLRKKEYYQERSQRSHECDLQEDGRLGIGSDYIKGRNLNVSNVIMQKVCWGSRTSVTCKPGELSSVKSSGVDGVKLSLDKDDASSGMKRKFSPTEWEMDDKKKHCFFNTKSRSTEWEPVALPSAPLPPQKFYEPNSTKMARKSEDLSISFDQMASKDLSKAQQLNNGDDVELMEEDYVPAKTFSLSRWSDENGTIEDDDGAVYDAEVMPDMRKIMPLATSQDQSHGTGGEVSEGSTSVSYDSCELCPRVSLESMDDSDGNLDFYRDESNVEEIDELEAGCWIRTLESVGPPCRGISMLQGCRSVDEFHKLSKINEGTYGVVYRARDKKVEKLLL